MIVKKSEDSTDDITNIGGTWEETRSNKAPQQEAEREQDTEKSEKKKGERQCRSQSRVGELPGMTGNPTSSLWGQRSVCDGHEGGARVVTDQIGILDRLNRTDEKIWKSRKKRNKNRKSETTKSHQFMNNHKQEKSLKFKRNKNLKGKTKRRKWQKGKHWRHLLEENYLRTSSTVCPILPAIHLHVAGRSGHSSTFSKHEYGPNLSQI